ncbi:MAG: isoquinoline 1-oxidoreductase, partial [Candidatus Aminicenantes bacterium]|nr:isoquinoline 1-oxidoreductase [Candidatus Aminicenantes bacterium]
MNDEINPQGLLRRRDFFKLLGGGIIVVVAADEGAAQEPARIPAGRGGYPTDFNAYLRVGTDGRVTCFTGKVEMGQGAATALPQMLAEDLDVPVGAVDIILGDTDLCPSDMGTFGSQTIRSFGPALRAAAAEARAVLIELAGERLGLPKERLETKEGTVFDRENPAAKATYADLAKGQKIVRKAEPRPSPKPPAQFAVIGRPLGRREAREKVTGRAKYAGDIRPTGMLYAKILRPPAHGAKRTSLDTAEAESVPGLRLVHDGDLVAVLHEFPDVAEAALAKVKATYDLPPADVDEATIYERLAKAAPAGKAVASGGKLEEGEKAAAWMVEQTYLNAYVAHAAMETHTAVVEYDRGNGKAMAWISTQAPFRARDEIAMVLELPAASVRVITPYVGGGFGGKTRNTQAVEAARLAKAVGRPVQVAWSREEEFFYDTFRPAALVRVKSGLSAEGRVVLWDYEVLWAGERSSQQFYDIPHHRTVVRGEWGGGGGASGGGHPFDVGAWRAPASNTNTFARESQIDIMAAQAGVDPLEFRLRNLANPRMARVLQGAAEAFGWKSAPAPSGRGWGIACADYLGTYVAAAAEVMVDRETGVVKVERIACAQDSGVAVNPEGARLQVEGCLTMGLGYALSEEVRFKGRQILDRNFDTYELPRFSGLPKIETVLLDSPELAPSGGGEPAIILMGGLI